jgi:hypothetical protein
MDRYLNGSESGGGHLPAGFFASSGPRDPTINLAGKKKGRTHETIDSPKTENSSISGCTPACLLCHRLRSASSITHPKKSSQLFIRSHNETLSVAVCVSNPDCSRFAIQG